MDIFLGIVFLVLIIMFPRFFLKMLGFFAVGFFLGLKGFNPKKW